MNFSALPTLNGVLAISLDTSADIGPVTWSVVSEPSGSSLQLTPASDGKSVTMTPTVDGEYQIKVLSLDNATVQLTTFNVDKQFTFNKLKVDGYDSTKTIEDVIGTILNQAWVYSTYLTESAIRVIVADYPSLTIIDYDDIQGLLVEFDETSITALEALASLELETGIDSVDYRVHEGDNVPRGSLIPADGSAFDDGGDNWHLERIGITDAWDYTTGSDEFFIGICDAGFDGGHEDLAGRFTEILTSIQDTHGTAVAGTIGAISDNQLGISGINWITQMVANRWGYSNLKQVMKKEKDGKKVLLVSNSWGNGYIPEAFDPTDDSMTKKRLKKSVNRTRSYRKLALKKKFRDRLYLWAAGNGVGNGASTSGYYGVDAIYDNGALQLNKKKELEKLDNILVVAALAPKDIFGKNVLFYYSCYGETVDIAAPSHFKTPKEGTNVYNNSFGGTSAATPVVSGVASLIYSLYPGFTPAEVKAILIDSATETVKNRYILPNDLNYENALLHPIPILNASAALDLAQQKINKKLKVSHSFPDPFTAQARISLSSYDSNYHAAGAQWTIESASQMGGPWQTIDSATSGTDTFEVPVSPSELYHRLILNATLVHNTNSSQMSASAYYYLTCSDVVVAVKDNVSLAPLQGVELLIEKMFLIGIPIPVVDTTAADGAKRLYLPPGNYKIRGQLSGYQQGVVSATVTAGESLVINLPLTPNSAASTGSVSGYAYDSSAQSVAGVLIRISGGSQTNGFFASATTDKDGYYQLTNISKIDSIGSPINSFTLSATAPGFTESVKENVIILSGKDRTENFFLTEGIPTTTVYSESFENGDGGWVGAGFWQRRDFSTQTLVNTLVDAGYTSLAPDEAGPQALLPNAYDGSFAWWYGQADTGTFIGVQYPGDTLLSGGTSQGSSYFGTLTSPDISLSGASSPILRLYTWWEIESVNPNADGYDLMDIKLSTDGVNFTPLKRLNPFVDPNDTDRDHKPFSSSGFNREPIWVFEEIDLSAYAGQTIRLRFEFDTVDELYNGFRGWLVDNISIIDGVQAKTLRSKAVKRFHLFDNLSDEYVNTHKLPQTRQWGKPPPRTRN